MKKIIVACNSGLGTSLMIRLNVEALLKEWGLKAWSELVSFCNCVKDQRPL